MCKAGGSWWIAVVCLVYWIPLVLFVYFDLYLEFDSDLFFLKLLAPVVLVANIVGFSLGVQGRSGHRIMGLVAMVMNLLPIMGVLWFIWWLGFGVKI